MQDQEQGAKNPERDQRATTPTPSVDSPFTIFDHDGFTRPHEGKAQIGPVFDDFRATSRLRAEGCRVTLSQAKMNPDKLFDYLDGKLSPNERAELEERFMSDPEARRELAVARQIHANMGDSREAVGVADAEPVSERGAVLSRRIMIAFMILVFVNVGFGIYAIFFMKNKQLMRERTEQNRIELARNLAQTAATALPTPRLEAEEIKFTAPASDQQKLTNKIIDEAKAAGGSAAKGLDNDQGVLIFAEVPSNRVDDFRKALSRLGGTEPSPPPATGEKMILQVRIAGGQ